MSGIYIPGERIPDTLTAFWIFPDGYVRVFGKNGDEIRGREAIPVPQHGRLGDLDAAVEKLKRLREYHSDDSQSGVFIAHGISQCIEVLTGKAAPTIIPAEEGQ